MSAQSTHMAPHFKDQPSRCLGCKKRQVGSQHGKAEESNDDEVFHRQVHDDTGSHHPRTNHSNPNEQGQRKLKT
jgi:hypothetical protein